MKDIANWQAMLMTGIIWPAVVYMWNRRTHSGITNLNIIVNPAGGVIPTGESCPYLVLNFINNTGQIIYIANGTIEVTNRIHAHPDADMDIGTRRYPLKFAVNAGNPFDQLQVTLNTGRQVSTGLPLSNEYTQQRAVELIGQIRRFRRLQFMPWYFTLRFDAMIGRELKRIKFNY